MTSFLKDLLLTIVLCFFSLWLPEIPKSEKKKKRKKGRKEADKSTKFIASKYQTRNGKQLDKTSGLRPQTKSR